MKSTLFGSALILMQAFVAEAAWASGNGAVAGGTAGPFPWSGDETMTVAAVAGVVALAILIGGVAVFRTSKSDSPFDSFGTATRR